jgi:hypothetical protein
MNKIDELIFRATKEIMVKFIEIGRVSPTGFHETFKAVYQPDFMKHSKQYTIRSKRP